MNEYKLTEDEFAQLMEASKPVPYMVIGGVEPQSPRDKSMRIWERVAARVGCDMNSIQPNGADPRDFKANPTP